MQELRIVSVHKIGLIRVPSERKTNYYSHTKWQTTKTKKNTITTINVRSYRASAMSNSKSLYCCHAGKLVKPASDKTA